MRKRLTAALLTLSLMLSLTAGAWADSSTTTYRKCYKDDSPNTEMYLVTDRAYSDYIDYGAMYEPDCGVYYGRTCSGDVLPSGDWGTVNADESAGESALSFYTSLENGYSNPYDMEYWKYLYGSVIADGKHIFVMNLNFEKEADDCTEVINGTYDESLKNDFTWLSTLTCPVFLRIGAEVNVWDNRPDGESFIAAYRHIAELAREYCPNVALMYSPNSSSSYGIDLDTYYPGDDCVDWIGTSLYYNRYADNGDTVRDGFYGVNTYADAVLKLQQVINLSDMHQKPVMITESGSARRQLGEDTSDFAADCVTRAYSYLTMVYPQLKCIIYSDTNFGLSESDPDANLYSIYDNETVSAAYDQATASNPTLLSDCSGTASYYTKVSAYTGSWTGRLQLAAYTYAQEKLTADWYVDGVRQCSTGDTPYFFTLDADSLSSGTHMIKVVFSNGEIKAYTFNTAGGETVDESDQIYARFDDVKKDDWFVPYVKQAYDGGMMSGTSSNTFSPSEDTSRAMVVQILYAMKGYPDTSDLSTPFTDVPEGQWYSAAVAWAYDQQVTGGTSETTFSPDACVKREELALLLYAYAGRPEITGALNGFADTDLIDFWAETALVWAVENGIISGSTEDDGQLYLNPRNGASRAEAAAMMLAFRNYCAEVEADSEPAEES